MEKAFKKLFMSFDIFVGKFAGKFVGKFHKSAGISGNDKHFQHPNGRNQFFRKK